MNINPYEKLKKIKEFTKNDDCIIFLLKSRVGYLITCSQDKEINIYDPKSFEVLLSWTGHNNSINCICELNNSRLASCSDDKRIAIWLYNIEDKKVIQETVFTAHTSFINKIITLENDDIASCSEDKTILIWSSSYPYNKKISLIGHGSEVTSIIQMKNKKIISTCGNKGGGELIIWTFDTNYNKIINIESIK